MTLSKFAGAAALATMLLSSIHAAAQAPSPGVREACAGDVARLCSDVPQQDRRAVMQCMRQHMDGVSTQCKAAFAARRQASQARRAAPGQDGAQTEPAPTAPH